MARYDDVGFGSSHTFLDYAFDDPQSQRDDDPQATGRRARPWILIAAAAALVAAVVALLAFAPNDDNPYTTRPDTVQPS